MTFIVANWKMHPQTFSGAKVLTGAIRRALSTKKGITVVVAPPAVFLRELAKGSRSNKVLYAAQDVHFEKEGAFTGAISAWQAKDAGATYVLVGHSERRRMGETNDDVRKKVAAVLAAGLKPILCVGEQVRDDEGDYLEAFSAQVLEGLADVPKNKLKDVLIAYEPVWAIGKEESMTPHLMHEMSLYIRKLLMEPFGKAALAIPILYGGAITEVNAEDMLEGGEVQGLLVGHVSVDPVRFGMLLRSIKGTR